MTSHVVREWPGADQMLPAHHDEATPVAPGVWMSPGLSNSFLVVADGARVVINTGMGFEAPVHKRVYDAVDGSPIRYILLTQGHVDHVGGVDVLREESTEVVAQRLNLRCQADDARIHRFRLRRSMPFFSSTFAAVKKPAVAGSPAPQARPVPDVLFEDELVLEVGNTRFELYSTPGGETVDQMTVWMPQQRIAFVGNLFGALFGHFPNLVTLRGDRYRDPLALIASADRVLALEPEVLCVGHFGPLVGAEVIREEITRIRDAVEFVHDATVTGMNSGIDLTTLMREVRLPDHLALGEGYGRIDWSVRAIWESYAGWFKAESTTELYPASVRDVYADVVACAGSDALLAAAEEHLDEGRPTNALHLVEMVTSTHATDTAAWELHRRIHEHLLAGSSNFWEARWLKHQLQVAARALGDDSDANRQAVGT